jgi:hypothetical protein
MKAKFTFLFVFLCSMASLEGRAQCDPNPLYADSVFGVWPDTLTGFPVATVDEAYFAQLDIMVPASSADVPEVDLPFTLPIDSGKVDAVAGLPAGLSYQCNSQTPAPCTYLPQQLGCAAITGIPTEEGVFPLTITVTAYSFFLQVVEAPLDFTGYQLVVSDGTVSVEEIAKDQLSDLLNLPNPFSGSTEITFSARQSMPVEFVVVDLLGKQVHREQWRASAGANRFTFEPSSLESGIYLYSVITPQSTLTKRMVYSAR